MPKIKMMPTRTSAIRRYLSRVESLMTNYHYFKVIYFRLHRGSVEQNTASWQARAHLVQSPLTSQRRATAVVSVAAIGAVGFIEGLDIISGSPCFRTGP